jgi:hypothetical protein
MLGILFLLMMSGALGESEIVELVVSVEAL